MTMKIDSVKPGTAAVRKRRQSHPVSQWWTRRRVENGLRRYQRDFFPDNEADLPESVHAYQKVIPAEEKLRPTRERIYPTGDAVLYHFDCLLQAWWLLGFNVVSRRETTKIHELTPAIETELRKVYSLPFKNKKRQEVGIPSIADAARDLKVPAHTLKKFARELGLTRTKDLPWSEEEIKILDEQGYKSTAGLARIFRQKGFKRTEVAIQLMRARRRSHKASPFFSLSAIARLFGVDGHLVTDWVEKGWLKAEYKETRKNKGDDHRGDTRVADKDSIYRFVVAHPESFDLRRVDQLWFLHMITRGDVEFIKSERLSARSEGQLVGEPVDHKKKRQAARAHGQAEGKN